MDEKQLMALARKNAAKEQTQNKRRPVYDATLDATRTNVPDNASETTRFFKEMKRREF